MTTSQSLRILDYRVENGVEQYQVEYPAPRGVRWVHAFAIGGQYAEEKKAVKFRWEQRQAKLDLTESADETAESSPGISPISIKCICMHVHPSTESDLILCGVCRKHSHLRCVFPEWSSSQPLSKTLTDFFACPFCRVKFLDPFTPASEILAFSLSSRSKDPHGTPTFTVPLKFQLDSTLLTALQSRQSVLAIRSIAVSANAKFLNGPLWPATVTATVNNFQDVFKILPPKFGHHRKEAVQKNIEDLGRPSFNEARLVCEGNVEPGMSEHIKYMMAVVVTSTKSVEDLVRDVRRLTAAEANAQDRHILKTLYERYVQLQSNDLLIASNFEGDIVSTRCPLTLSEIQVPVRGGSCMHLQCYDLAAYVDVNHKMRNVEKRWKCPVCNRTVKPEDLVVDTLFQEVCVARQEPRRLRLRVGDADVRTAWEELPDEELVGEAEDSDQDDHALTGPEAKRPRLADRDGQETTHGKPNEQIVLDLE